MVHRTPIREHGDIVGAALTLYDAHDIHAAETSLRIQQRRRQGTARHSFASLVGESPLFKHAVRNSLIPLISVMAVDIGLLFGGLIITETIFSIPGMGRLFFDSLLNGDVVVLEAWMLVVAVFILGFNLIADLLYGVLDPRIRVG